jgi:diadenosine tetraphosphatase ApaH/serine/threonine PP2A family protein phosphatase
LLQLGDGGPFDIVGDVHGCFEELAALLGKLGYRVDRAGLDASPPEGRRAVFLGDLCDRGPRSAEALGLVMNMADSGAALCVKGNHEAKLLEKLRGRVFGRERDEDAENQIRAMGERWVHRAERFMEGLAGHYVFDGGALVVAHAGLREQYHGEESERARHICLYGETTGKRDEHGFPIRRPWVNEYGGRALVVYGHTPVVEARFVNNTICLDTGCVFGGSLTALRYPEREIVSVPAARTYRAPVLPLGAPPEGE